jgi:hypothetical protein
MCYDLDVAVRDAILLGVMAVEKGILDLKDLRPVFLRLLPGYKMVAQRLPDTRVQLQRDVRAACKKYGPDFGSLYYDKSGDWEKAYVKVINNTGGSTTMPQQPGADNDKGEGKEGIVAAAVHEVKEIAHAAAATISKIAGAASTSHDEGAKETKKDA